MRALILADCTYYCPKNGRDHLAGALGAAMSQRFFKLGWAQCAKGSRVVNFSPLGERKLREQFS